MASRLSRAPRRVLSADQCRKEMAVSARVPSIQEFMERARVIWEEERLPQLKAKVPWHGYELGHWPEELKKWPKPWPREGSPRRSINEATSQAGFT